MPTRLIIAYSLIALMIAATAALIWWKAYHSHRRTGARRRKRDADRYRSRREAAGSAVERNTLG